MRPAEEVLGYLDWPVPGSPMVQPGQFPPAVADRTPQELPGLEDRELLRIVHSPDSTLRSMASEILVSRYSGLVRSCVRRYWYTPEPTDDLMQVGYVGLLKAIGNYDPAFGRGLAAYAQPCISGELKRHFRDKRWPLRVQRPMQELVLEIREESGKLAQDLGRMPAESDLARHLGVTGAAVREARRAEMAFQPSSLDAPVGEPGTGSLADLLGAEDPRLENMLGMQSVAAHWSELPAREQGILVMRFYHDMTQAQIGKQLGISQMHVSRLMAHALGHLRVRLLGEPEHLAARKVPARERLSPARS